MYLNVTEQTGGGENDILLPNGHTLVLQGSSPHTRFTLPTTQERHLSMPEIGEKERDYLFKELHKLKSSNLMSSLRSQSPLEYPPMHSPSFPLCPVQGTVCQKKK